MSDQSFHEVQLSGKQLFFLFMCAVVLAGVIFIFGVSVGRGVKNASSLNAQTDVPGDTTVPADVPTTPAANPNEVSYAQALQGRGPDPATVTPPAPPAEEPASAKAAAGNGTPATTTAPAATAAPKPAPATPSPKTETPKPGAVAPKTAPAGEGFVVQVEAFGSNDVASREVAKLQRQGHAAKVFSAPEGTPGRFKVQIGPFATRAEADKTIKALRTEGYSPVIKR